MKKALLFLNGEAPDLYFFSKNYLQNFSKIICTDGAYNYLHGSIINPEIVIGDFDSINLDTFEIPNNIKLIKIYDQNTTDFDKALQYLVNNNFSSVEVWGSSGSFLSFEADHFLGNLSSALRFKEKINIVFYSQKQGFYFLEKKHRSTVKPNSIVSLYPFPYAKGVYTEGLQYPLIGDELNINNRIGIRNKAISANIKVSFSEGAILFFYERN